ncbi:FAD-binding domain-containing protein [Cucurbitaria berberidis CBS 394.84]|uniref:FAD-binding domain-containing protein n=1 Tax=Cucurbitaria berberidis CBS 394.84 TaxID=1168544 RepID=A0A9P4GRR3_9PLEO|nr:FAD-binding domain-containing protein [Cucurbitaria berberidis CBS 394.84]KAF1850545.1 FAD-binding domain-containing protein [Cucurbitaria berberidis CBS 394.84]
MLSKALITLLLAARVVTLNFDWERDQVIASAIANAISHEGCKITPGDDNWPSEEKWASFNETLGGALLKPKPLASLCYAGDGYNAEKCEQLRDSWAGMNLHSDDPTSVMSQWASGNTCVPTSHPNSTCAQGGYPVYVVKATSIRHIQLAVDFARNNHIRLVIKNSGHDFNGKSIGGHSLSVWTHHLKDLVYHANYSSPTGSYTGRAVAYAAGVQAFEGSALMRRNNMTFIIAGGTTVGIAGGFLQGGGHSSYTSYYGLAADQVLAITAVTADGKVVEAHEGQNEDLFWAFRGGGGGTFGIITSVVVKAFPNTPLVSGSIRFSTTPTRGTNATAISHETFWAGMKAYWEFGTAICDAGGLGYNFIYPNSSITGLTFTVSISLPKKTLAEYRSFVRPLLEKLNSLGIALPVPTLKQSFVAAFDNEPPFPLSRRTLGDITGHTLIASRLFPRSSFSSNSSLHASHLAIRHLVEDGDLTFHGMSYSPTLAVAGNPSNAVNPAFRNTVLHAQGYENGAHWDGKAPVRTKRELTERHERLQGYMQVWRDATVGGGSYINEGDAQDWTWKEAFFGNNYPKLAQIKRKYDPEGVFWAVGAVGSDEWEVRDLDGKRREGIVTQDGKLCRAGGA